MNVLYEDNHLLVVDKPAAMATMGAEPGVPTVHQWAADYLKRRYNKPGNVFVGVVSRLDRVTTGVLVLARTSKAASRLAIQFGGPGSSKKVSNRAEKVYLAMVAGDLENDSGLASSGILIDSVWKDDAAHRMRVDRSGRSDAQQARLKYVVIDKTPSRTLIAVRLLTGRKHQIRLQFSERGHPVLGDLKYGCETPFSDGVALHSWQLRIAHPTKMNPLLFRAPIPVTWFRRHPSIPSEAVIESILADALDGPTDITLT
jgi:23S rRNA pseudouridine1911/1915/1917 synthase